MDERQLARMLETARGDAAADLVIKSARVLDLIDGSMREADIAICQGRIVGLGEYEGHNEIDAAGLIALPGFIDGHVHIESSMLVPERFAEAVVPRGTTARANSAT